MTGTRARTALALVVLAGWGCGDDPSRNETVAVSLSDLPCEGVDEIGIWQSAPPFPRAVGDCGWLLYEGNTTYVFEHPLGRVPSIVAPYIAFEPDGLGSTLASGNAFSLQESTETTVALRNSQNQDFWLRLALF